MNEPEIPTTPEEFLRRRQLLTAALRSGDYAQSTCFLNRVESVEGIPAGFCCLGVATDIFHKETGQGKWSDDGIFLHGEERAASILPVAVQNWFGFGNSMGRHVSESGVTCFLTAINDHGASFVQIADIIDSNPEDLFTK